MISPKKLAVRAGVKFTIVNPFQTMTELLCCSRRVESFCAVFVESHEDVVFQPVHSVCLMISMNVTTRNETARKQLHRTLKASLVALTKKNDNRTCRK